MIRPRKARAMTMNADREFIFGYRFAGQEWSTTVFANNPTEAREKVKAMALARYDGELMMRIPAAASGFGAIPRIITWWKNRKLDR